jgi:nicotinic acid mononucleotide adenylyltransferase
MPFKFEKLQVWNDAVELSGLVHVVCLSFPKEEFYVLTPQLKRATDSNLILPKDQQVSQIQSLKNF